MLLPVLDDDKHYWVGDDEVDKLLRRGGDWLAAHPERELIARRYLRHDRRLTRDALGAPRSRPTGRSTTPTRPSWHTMPRKPRSRSRVRLNEQRMDAVVAALRDAGAQRIVDLGCGEGTLVRALLKEAWVDRVVGVDVSWRSLEIAAAPPAPRRDAARASAARVDLWQGALTYRDRRLRGLRRGRGRGGHRAPRSAAARRVRGRVCSVMRARGRPSSRRRTSSTTSAVRGHAAGSSPPQGPPLRVDPCRVRARGATASRDRHGYAVRLTGRSARRTTRGGQPTQMAVFSR